MITVTSKRTGGVGEYIGRPSPLGNPFTIGPDGTREQVIEYYRQWLRNIIDEGGHNAQITELNRLKEIVDNGDDLVLQCWCAPLACHGDVIKEYIEETPCYSTPFQ